MRQGLRRDQRGEERDRYQFAEAAHAGVAEHAAGDDEPGEPGELEAVAAERGGDDRWPVLVDVSAEPGRVAEARSRAALLAPVLAGDEPATVDGARAAIDRVDAALATLLERRAELAGVVQQLKPVGGFAGRDMGRERQIVETMAVRAPRLGADRIARIMSVVIEAGLQVSEEHDLSPA